MSKRRQHSELVWLKPPHAGFGAGGTYAVLYPEIGFLFNKEVAARIQRPMSQEEWWAVANVEIIDQTPCMLDCDDPNCMEWTNVWTVAGASRTEAMANVVARSYTGANYHVSECEMVDDQE